MKFGTLIGGAAAALATSTAACAAEAQDPGQAILHGKPILEMRLRYEGVEQQGLARKAEALTLRTRAGWQTATWRGLNAAVEIDDVRAIAREAYNIAAPGVAGGSLNGRTRFPIINDPEVTELNRAQVAWTPSAAFRATVGRQRILIEDQRFVGSVAWRQDDQTFDAARLEFTHGPLSLGYAYVDRVNRILGDERDWRSDSHLLTAGYAFDPRLRLHGFAYLLDFPNAPLSSSQTWGVKAAGGLPAGGLKLAYDATWATQSDYGHAPAAFDLGYRAANVAATRDIWTLKGGYEVLEGDGSRGFIFPLATTHAFQGWSDAFAAVGGNKTFPDGIRDLNVQLAARPKLKAARLSNLELVARYHDFDADRTGARLGHEWDLQGTAAVTPHLNALVKFARFERAASAPTGAAPPPASRTKLWFSLEYRL